MPEGHWVRKCHFDHLIDYLLWRPPIDVHSYNLPLPIDGGEELVGCKTVSQFGAKQFMKLMTVLGFECHI